MSALSLDCIAVTRIATNRGIVPPGGPLNLPRADALALEGQGALRVEPPLAEQDAAANRTARRTSSAAGQKAPPGPGEQGAPASAEHAPEGRSQDGGEADSPEEALPPHPDASWPTSTVKGIGARADAQLASLGIGSVGRLAALPDDRLGEIAPKLKIVGNNLDVLAGWRDAARALLRETGG